ncbi:extracellular solute-binding protein [Paenibacillus sp. GYB003]|uniref:extracellular solute-binding protein n=1 Tax=Paenibacillus sp. GYB003 TaxID=2994392 RepID=UPI002F9656A8
MKRNDFRYVEMAGLLRTEIMSGYLQPGQYLLPETELCRKYAISRNSLRQALDLLTEEGLLVRQRGRGNRVADRVRPDGYGPNTLVLLSPYRSSFAEEGLPLLVSAFRRDYPDVDVKLLYTGYLADTIMRDLTGFGVKPDLVLAWDRHFIEFDRREFVPLTRIVPDEADVPGKLLQAFRKQDELYAAPVTYSPVFLACNPALFEAAGVHMPALEWSMEQFAEAAKRLTRDEGGGMLRETYGFGLSGSLIRWPVLAMNFGYRRETEDGRSGLDRLEEALGFMQRLLYRDRVCPVSAVGDWLFLNELFEDGRLAMLLTTTLATPMRRRPFPLRVLPLPRQPGVTSGSLAIANGLMVSRSASNPELARRFIEYAVRHDFQRRMSQQTGFLSIYDSVNRDVWSAYERSVLGIDRERMDRSCFIHDLFPVFFKPQELEGRMKPFWAGLESPRHLVASLFADRNG